MPELWRSVECFLVLLRAFECLWLLCNALKWFWLLCRTLELCPVQCRQSALVWSIMGAPTLTSAAPLLSACIWTSFFFIGSGHHQHKHLTPQGKVWRIGGARSAKIFQQHTCATTFYFSVILIWVGNSHWERWWLFSKWLSSSDQGHNTCIWSTRGGNPEEMGHNGS